jgi:hypothetical protein
VSISPPPQSLVTILYNGDSSRVRGASEETIDGRTANLGLFAESFTYRYPGFPPKINTFYFFDISKGNNLDVHLFIKTREPQRQTNPETTL